MAQGGFHCGESAVCIAMTVAAHGKAEGTLVKVIAETPMEHGENDFRCLMPLA